MNFHWTLGIALLSLLVGCGDAEQSFDDALAQSEADRAPASSGQASGYVVCSSCDYQCQCPSGTTRLFYLPDAGAGYAVANLSHYRVSVDSCSQISAFRDPNYSSELYNRNYYCHVTLTPKPLEALASTDASLYIGGPYQCSDGKMHYPFVTVNGRRLTTKKAAKIWVGNPAEFVLQVEAGRTFYYDPSGSWTREVDGDDGEPCTLWYYLLQPPY